MKRKVSLFLLVVVLLTSFTACSSNDQQNFSNDNENSSYNENVANTAEDPLSGIWEVIEGGDDHSIVIANGNIQIIDGPDTIICKYTKPSDNAFQFEFDGESWELKYNNGLLYRYENGRADGYVYERTAYNSNK